MELREYTDKNGNAYTGYGLTFSVKEAGIGDRISYSFANAIDFCTNGAPVAADAGYGSGRS